MAFNSTCIFGLFALLFGRGDWFGLVLVGSELCLRLVGGFDSCVFGGMFVLDAVLQVFGW